METKDLPNLRGRGKGEESFGWDMNLVYVSRLFSIMHYACCFVCFCVYFVFVVVLFSFLCVISTSISLLLPPLPLLNTSSSLILYVVYLWLSLPWLAAVCPKAFKLQDS